MFPVEILAIILETYPLKNARLICSSLTYEYQTRYWNNMIISKYEVKDYIKDNVYFLIDNYPYYHFKNFHINTDLERINVSRNYIMRFANESLDIISQYKVLSCRFTDVKYKNIIRNKILTILKSKQLAIYCNTLNILSDTYIWLMSHCYIATLNPNCINFTEYNSIVESRILTYNEKLTLLRANLKIAYKILYDYINAL
jgi:hypothetical protein